MMRSPLVRWTLGALLLLVVLGVLRSKPWQRAETEATVAQNAAPRETLAVGFLPVTCHLTCPVTDFASKTSPSTRFESQRFTDFPTVVETMKSGRLQASFMIAPLAMKLREQGLKVKIAYLGHRDGSTVMVRSDLTQVKSLKDLKGMTFAIPNKASNQNLVIRKLIKDQGLSPDDIRFVELPPPDMPGALATKAIDAYFIGEPHAARAELDGTGRILYHAKDIWPHFISCVLVVTEKLIDERPGVVKDLVRGIAESGEWAETHRLEAARLVSPYFRQDEKLLRHVLTQPPDRVSYRMLTPADDEMQRIADMALEAGVLERRLDVHDLVDRRFIPADIKAGRNHRAIGARSLLQEMLAILAVPGTSMFIDASYWLLLGRAPDEHGREMGRRLESGQPRETVPRALISSTRVPLPLRRPHRRPLARRSAWRTSIRRSTRSGSDAEFLSLCYECVLGRPADDGGLGWHLGELARGLPRSTALWTMLTRRGVRDPLRRHLSWRRRLPADVQLCELANPAKWDNPEWMAVLRELKLPAEHRLAMHRKAYEFTQTVWGLAAARRARRRRRASSASAPATRRCSTGSPITPAASWPPTCTRAPGSRRDRSRGTSACSRIRKSSRRFRTAASACGFCR